MGEYFGTINDVKVFEKNKLYCFHSDFSYDVYDIKGEDDMKDYLGIYELKKQVNELMNCAYQRGYDNGKLDAEKDEEKKQNDEIKVGDEVIFRFDEIGVVTGTTDDGYVYVTSKFGWSDRFGKMFVKKTGRHFNEIKNVLRKMGEEE